MTAVKQCADCHTNDSWSIRNLSFQAAVTLMFSIVQRTDATKLYIFRTHVTKYGYRNRLLCGADFGPTSHIIRPLCLFYRF
jgi:hypothetical protein